MPDLGVPSSRIYRQFHPYSVSLVSHSVWVDGSGRHYGLFRRDEQYDLLLCKAMDFFAAGSSYIIAQHRMFKEGEGRKFLVREEKQQIITRLRTVLY